MSQHSSFHKGKSALSSNKTVLKRFERIELLKKEANGKKGKAF